MQEIQAPVTLVKSVNQKMMDLIFKISGTMKRYNNVLLNLYQLRNLSKAFTHETLADYFSRKFKLSEGFIMSHQVYEKLFNHPPTQLDIENLVKACSARDLSLVPLYKKMNENDPPVAIFICLHREQYIALEIYEELREIITGIGKTNNPHSQFIKAAIKVSEELGKMSEKKGEIYRQDIYDAVQLLSGNEVYMVSITYCIEHHIDPKKLEKLLSDAGFEILVLTKDLPSTETNEMYKYYDSLLGIAISRTNEGLELAKANMKILLQVCEAAESGLPKAAIETTGAQHV